jgi:hypothetical protein
MKSSDINFLFISWPEFHDLCFKLAKKVLGRSEKFDRIVCISRGGLVVARILSDYLDLPISNFTIVSYVTLGETGEPKIVEELGVKIRNERILLVDEIADNGSTLGLAVSYLKKFSPKKLMTLVPIIKPWSKPKPSFWQKMTERWVVFPYEIKETMTELVGIYKRQGLSKKEIRDKVLLLLGDQKQIKYFLTKALKEL